MDYKKQMKDYYKIVIDTINNLNYEEINTAMNAIDEVYERGGSIYICGNGGSAATASHYTNDFNKGISEYVDKKYRFVCLNDNFATVMAIANDISYDEVFSFQLNGRITKNDMLIAISGSGNSKNIIRAVEEAQKNGTKVLGMSGYRGGKLREMADYHMHVDIENMMVVEDVHMTFDHMMFSVFLASKRKNS
jgi:D-sedoheptulose 7-phosphate isomerase